MSILSPRLILTYSILIIIIGFSFTSVHTFMVRAAVYNLYAATCLGGWENTHLATGAPQALESGGAPIFTEGNSARLNGDAHAQIYCGGFKGDILENTVPKKILVKFSWAVEYPKLNTEAFQTNEELTTELEATQPEELPTVPEVIEPAPEQAQEEPTASIFNFFATVVHAQEIQTEDSAETSTEVISYGLVEVLYTLDGVEWKSLGFVKKDEFGSKYFEIPIKEASEWEDISKIQVGIQSVPVIDGIAPIIFLDSVWLQTEYEYYSQDSELQLANVVRSVTDIWGEASEEIVPVDGVENIEEELNAEETFVEEAPPEYVDIIPPPLVDPDIYKDIVVDLSATHRCEAYPFNIDISEKSNFFTDIKLESTSEEEHELRIGDLPHGVEIIFSNNNESLYRPKIDEDTVSLLIRNEDDSRHGNFSIPIIYTKKGDKDSSVICQINIINL